MRWKPIPLDNALDDPQAYKDGVRLNALGSLFFFASHVLKNTRLAKLHHQMCRSLEADDLHLVLEEPMGHFKTTVGIALSMWYALPFTERDEWMMRKIGYDDSWIAWMKRAHDANTSTLITHEIESRAISMGKAVDDHYKWNDMFRFVFPEILPDGSTTWNDHAKFQKRIAGQPKDATTGTYEYRGVGQALQGIHPKNTIQDDNMGKAAQSSMLNGDGRVLEELIRWHRQLTTRLDSPTQETFVGRQLVIGNRWAHNDLNSWIAENQPQFKFETHSAEGGCCKLHPAGRPIFPEEWTMERLAQRRRDIGPYDYCFPAEAPVLMSDWTEKRIDEIKPGDEVVGYRQGSSKGAKRQQRWHLVKSRVLATNTRLASIVQATMSSGRQVRCTADHRWFSANRRKGKIYERLFSGNELVSVYTPSPVKCASEQRDLDWLGGLMDGEGSCNPSSLNIAQSESKNPEVCKEIEECCDRLGISYHRNRARISPAGKEGYSWNLHGGRSLLIRMVQNARMAKRARFMEKLWSRPGRVCEEDGLETILSIEPIAETQVHNIETETGNYVAYGYATKNCHFYLNQSVLPEECIFRKEWIRKFKFKQSRPDLPMDDLRNVLLIAHEVKEGETIEDFEPYGVLHVAVLVDLAHAKKRSRCKHVIAVVGFDPEKDWFYLLDLWAKTAPYSELTDQLYKMCFRWRVRDPWLEEVAAQNLLAFHISQRNHHEPIARRLFPQELPYDNSENAKKNRIESMEPVYRNGQFWCHPSYDGFYDEYNAYPASATVDVLDTLGYCIRPEVFGRIRSREALEFISGQEKEFAGRQVGAGGY